jgi:hypothetical protein
MKLFNRGAENLFKKTAAGKRAFYPYGILSEGYSIETEADYKRIFEKITEYNKNLFFYLLVPLLGSSIAIKFVHSDNNLLVVSLLSLYTFFWWGQYYRIMRKETASLPRLPTKLTGKLFAVKYAVFMMFFAGMYFGVLKLQDVIFSAN